MSNSNVLIHGRAVPGNQKLSIRCDEEGYLLSISTPVDQNGNYATFNGDGGITSRMQGKYYDEVDEFRILSVDNSGNLNTNMVASGTSLTATEEGYLNVNVNNANIDISGTIDVGNWPSTYDVSGSVDINNWPSTYDVSGTVNAIIDNSGSSILVYGDDYTGTNTHNALYVDANGFISTNVLTSVHDSIIYDLQISKASLTYGSGNDWVRNPFSSENGWYFTNNVASNIGYLYWYNNGDFSNLVSYPTQSNIQYNELDIFYSIMALYDVNFKPKIIIYSKPTGTGDYLPGVCHSIWEFSINTGAVLNTGENILLYFGNQARIKTNDTDVRRVALTLTATYGQAQATEIVGHIFIRTYATSVVNEYKLNVVECGLYHKQVGLLEYYFDNSIGRIAENNLNSLTFSSNKLQVDISGQKVDISGQKVDISGQNVIIPHLSKTTDSVDISGQKVDISGQKVDISGQMVDISGQKVDISGQKVDISGQKVDISGQNVIIPYLSKTTSSIDISGQIVDISGQNVIIPHLSKTTDSVDISGQKVDISGQTVDISGQTVDISGQTLITKIKDSSGNNIFSDASGNLKVNVASGSIQISSVNIKDSNGYNLSAVGQYVPQLKTTIYSESSVPVGVQPVGSTYANSMNTYNKIIDDCYMGSSIGIKDIPQFYVRQSNPNIYMTGQCNGIGDQYVVLSDNNNGNTVQFSQSGNQNKVKIDSSTGNNIIALATGSTVGITSTANSVKITDGTNTATVNTPSNETTKKGMDTNAFLQVYNRSNASNQYLTSTIPIGSSNTRALEVYAYNVGLNNATNLNLPITSTTTDTTQSMDCFLNNNTTTNDKITGFPTGGNVGLNMYVIPTKTKTFAFNAYTTATGTNAFIGSINSNTTFSIVNFGLANPRPIYVFRSATTSSTLSLLITYIDAAGNEQTTTLPAPIPTTLTNTGITNITVNKCVPSATYTTNDTISICFGNGTNFAYAGGDYYRTNNALFTCPNNAIAWVQNVSFYSTAAENLRLFKWDANGVRQNMFGWLNASNFNSNATGEYGFGGYITAGETIGWGGENSSTLKQVHSNVVVRYL